MKYIHQLNIWPKFTWNHEQIAPILETVRNRQGRLIGRMERWVSFSFGGCVTDDILDLVEKEILFKDSAGGRSINYLSKD